MHLRRCASIQSLSCAKRLATMSDRPLTKWRAGTKRCMRALIEFGCGCTSESWKASLLFYDWWSLFALVLPKFCLSFVTQTIVKVNVSVWRLARRYLRALDLLVRHNCCSYQTCAASWFLFNIWGELLGIERLNLSQILLWREPFTFLASEDEIPVERIFSYASKLEKS